jgi:predicted PurR-regulated permease PerM
MSRRRDSATTGGATGRAAIMRIERQVLFWLAVAVLFVVALLALRAILLPFLAGMVIAYALNPLADRLTTIGLPRLWASALIVALLIVALLLAFIFVVPLLVTQIQQLADGLPTEFDRMRKAFEEWGSSRFGARFGDIKSGFDRAIVDLSANWASVAGVVAQSVWAQGLALVNFVSLVLVTPLVVFYLLVDWYPMLEKIDRWLPRDHEATIRRLANDINGAISAFIRGQGLVCLILGTVYAIGLTWAGLRYGLLLGALTGLLCFVPVVGWVLGLILSATLALVEYWPDTLPMLKVVGVFALGQTLDVAFLSPKIVGSKIGLHPVWLIFSLFVFSYLFGLVGVLIAVPVAAAIAVLVRFALEVYLASSIYRGRDAESHGMNNETEPTG